jgi:hypothetical protein
VPFSGGLGKGASGMHLFPAQRPAAGRRLAVSALKPWLWEAACQIRGPLDAPPYLGPPPFFKGIHGGQVGSRSKRARKAQLQS